MDFLFKMIKIFNLPNSVSPSWNWESCKTRPLIPCAFRFPHCPAELNPVFLKLFWFWRGGRFCWALNWLTWTSDVNWFPVMMLFDEDPTDDCWWGWCWWVWCWWWVFGAGKNDENPSSPYYRKNSMNIPQIYQSLYVKHVLDVEHPKYRIIFFLPVRCGNKHIHFFRLHRKVV